MATNTYVALDQTTISSATPSITFNSIPDTYTDLVVICYFSASSSNVVTPSLRFNGDTTSAYSSTSVYGTGSTTTSVRNATTMMYLGDYAAGITTHAPDPYILHINSYRNTSTYKSVLCRYNQINSSNAEVGITAGLWRNQNAISSITILSNGGQNYAVGSTFALYGIRAEGISPAPKATGGAIYSDSTYYYHVFGATGTFTPSQSITADILIGAGGGGAGTFYGGGGGAGGLRQLSSQSLSSGVAYTATIGAGGAGAGSSSVKGTSGTASSFAGSGFSTINVSGGGGGGSNSNTAGVSGGSGGGGSSTGAAGSGNAGGYSPVEGYAGYTYNSGSTSGGGGSAAAAATNNNGANGTTAYSTWSAATGIGQMVNGTFYLAGGGSGYNMGLGGWGGGGGHGQGFYSGLANTSGGGGADGNSGGSGFVIVRYTKA